MNGEFPARVRLSKDELDVEEAAAIHEYEAKQKVAPAQTIEELHLVQQEAVDDFNEKYGVTPIGNQVVVLCEHTETENLLWTPAHFKLYNHRPLIQVSLPDGDKPARYESLAKLWLTHENRRTYSGFKFVPGGDAPEGYLNLWRGWGVDPEDGDCQPYLDHVFQIVCGGNEHLYGYLIVWMADAVQNPRRRPGTAVVLQGKQGSGKGITLNPFISLFGNHGFKITNPRHLTGHFNAHLETVQMLYADEAFNTRDKTAEGVLKGLVTEDLLTVERKGIDSYQAENHIRIVMSSNNEWVIPAGFDERRFFVLKVLPDKIGDIEYFRRIADTMKNGGCAALLHKLMHYDLASSGVELRRIPKTDGLIEQQVASMDAVASFWLDTLHLGRLLPMHQDWECTAETDRLFERFRDQTRDAHRRDRAMQTEFGNRLSKLCPSMSKHRPAVTETLPNGTERTRRVYAYTFPSPETCRREFEGAVGTTFDWDNVVASVEDTKAQ